MASVGIDRDTGRVLRGFAHVRQSLGVLFSTGIGSRILMRVYGSDVPPLLGENIVPSTFLKFATAVHVAVELWEPRYRLRQVTFPREANGRALIRKGQIGIALFGQYRPRGHLGDPTPEGADQTTLI